MATVSLVPFAYYERLSTRDQETYRRSDAVRALRVPSPGVLRPDVHALREALAAGDVAGVGAAAGRLCEGLSDALGVPPVDRVHVLEVRPRFTGGELHGVYLPGPPVEIVLWMKTAKHARVVAFRTFLRTLLHELCHHFDGVLLDLPRSLHTQGFFMRETSLFHQLWPEARAKRGST